MCCLPSHFCFHSPNLTFIFSTAFSNSWFFYQFFFFFTLREKRTASAVAQKSRHAVKHVLSEIFTLFIIECVGCFSSSQLSESSILVCVWVFVCVYTARNATELPLRVIKSLPRDPLRQHRGLASLNTAGPPSLDERTRSRNTECCATDNQFLHIILP